MVRVDIPSTVWVPDVEPDPLHTLSSLILMSFLVYRSMLQVVEFIKTDFTE